MSEQESGASPRPKSIWRWVKGLSVLVLIAGAGLAFWVYRIAFRPNLSDTHQEGYDLRIAEGTDYEGLVAGLVQNHVIEDESSFRWVSWALSFEKVKPGRYLLPAKASSWDMVRKLRRGEQDPIKLMFRSHRTLTELAEEIGPQLAFGKDSLLLDLRDPAFLRPYGLDSSTVAALFIPNTYQVYWNIKPRAFFDRMKQEFDSFWNETRKQKAESLHLSPMEVVVLASIVQAETYVAKERPTVAGLYLNRIRINMPLQADPTVIFANGDFTVKRVTNAMLEVDSPYNTYQVLGLPPGPINNPEISALDGVLNAEKHEYLYMCARCDLSGHNFSKTLAQHERYATEYRNCLNQQKIFR